MHCRLLYLIYLWNGRREQPSGTKAGDIDVDWILPIIVVSVFGMHGVRSCVLWFACGWASGMPRIINMLLHGLCVFGNRPGTRQLCSGSGRKACVHKRTIVDFSASISLQSIRGALALRSGGSPSMLAEVRHFFLVAASIQTTMVLNSTAGVQGMASAYAAFRIFF